MLRNVGGQPVWPQRGEHPLTNSNPRSPTLFKKPQSASSRFRSASGFAEDTYVSEKAPSEPPSDKTRFCPTTLSAGLAKPGVADAKRLTSQPSISQPVRQESSTGSTTDATVGLRQRTDSMSEASESGNDTTCVPFEQRIKNALEPLTWRFPRLKRLADSRVGTMGRCLAKPLWSFLQIPLFTAVGIGLILFNAGRSLLKGAWHAVRHPIDTGVTLVKTLAMGGVKLFTALVVTAKALIDAAVHPKRTSLAIAEAVSNLGKGIWNVTKSFAAWAKEHPYKAAGLLVGAAAMFTFAFYAAPLLGGVAATMFAGWGLSSAGATVLATACIGALTAGFRSAVVHVWPMVTGKDPWNGPQLGKDVNMSSFFGFFGFAHAALLVAVTSTLNIGWFALLGVNYVFLIGYEMLKDYVQVTLRMDGANDPKEFKDIWVELLLMESASNILRCIPGLEAHFGLEVTGDVVGTIIYDRIINARNKSGLPPEQAFPNPEDADARELLGRIQNVTSAEQLREIAEKLQGSATEKTEKAAILREAMRNAEKRIAKLAEGQHDAVRAADTRGSALPRGSIGGEAGRGRLNPVER